MKIGVLAFIIVLVLSIGFVLINPITTGNVALEIQETYGLNEPLKGSLSIVIEEGDIVSNESIVNIEVIKDGNLMESGEIFLQEIALLNQSDNESYFIPGEYTKAIEDIINYTFAETGSYIIKISIDSIELNVEKEIVVDSVIDGNESESSEDNESIDELGNLGTQDLSFGIMADLSPGNISSCGVLNQEGNYYLNKSLIGANVTAAGGGACFNITASNVMLDCQGYEIRNSTFVGMFFYAQYRTNLSVFNCIITGLEKGIHLANVNLSLFNNLTLSNHNPPINLIESFNNSFINISVSDSGWSAFSITGGAYNYIDNYIGVSQSIGFELSSTLENQFIDIQLTNSGDESVLLSGSSNNTFINVNLTGGSVGFYFDSDTAGAVTGNRIYNLTISQLSLPIYFWEATYPIENNVFSNLNDLAGSNIEIRDPFASEFFNYVFYNNHYGEIRWTNESFLKNLTLDGTITFPGTINISSNSAYVNVSAFTVGRINSSANITLRFDSSLTGYSGQKMLRNGVECNLTTSVVCYNFTSLSASSVVFNVSSVDGTFSIDRGTDSVAPSVTQNTPSVSQTSATVIFDASDNSGIANCTAYVNGNAFHNTTAIGELNNEIAITGLTASTAYTSYVNCTDLAGNVGNSSTLSFTTSAASTETTTSGGGGGGGGSSTTSNSITLSSEQFKNGYSSSLGVGDSYSLSITSNGKTEGHTITVKAIGTKTAELEIRSEVIKLVLTVGEGKKVDLNSDGIYDVLVQLNSITSDKAEISIKAVSEISSGGLVSSSEIIENKTIEDTVETEKPENKEWNMVLITAGVVCTVLVVGIGIFVFLILRAGKKKEK